MAFAMCHYQGKGSLFYQTEAAFFKGNCASRLAARVLLLIVGITLTSEIFLVNVGNSASQDISKPRSISQKREAWMDASDFSVAHSGVAFAVNGRTPDATNRQIAEFVKGRLAEKNIPSTYFTGREDSVGVSFCFYIDGHQYGPVGLSKLMATIDEVAGHSQALLRLQSN